MRDYTIHFKDGHTESMEVAEKQELINILFDGDEQQFKSKVEILRWESANMFFTEDVGTGKIDAQITTADTNPYGWRNEGEKEH